MTGVRNLFVALALGISIGGCSDRNEDTELPTEIVLERATAYRQACAAKELEQTAAENIEILESVLLNQENEDPTSAPNAAATFARGYHRHAELRLAMYAMVDSALNYAGTPEDSIRYQELAHSFTVRVPETGTVEANAMDAYNADLTKILSDDDHPCNWNIPGMTEQP